MAILPGRKKSTDRKGGGRRANYAPAPDQVGTRKYMPVGWANWLGFWLFGLIGIAFFVETVQATIEKRGADPIAGAIMTVVFFIMTYLFATTRIKD